MMTTKLLLLLLLLLFGGEVVVTSSCILSRTFEKQKWIGTYLGLGPFGHVFVHYGGIKYGTSISKTPREQSSSNYK